jgi:hypothetical protein
MIAREVDQDALYDIIEAANFQDPIAGIGDAGRAYDNLNRISSLSDLLDTLGELAREARDDFLWVANSLHVATTSRVYAAVTVVRFAGSDEWPDFNDPSASAIRQNISSLSLSEQERLAEYIEDQQNGQLSPAANLFPDSFFVAMQDRTMRQEAREIAEHRRQREPTAEAEREQPSTTPSVMREILLKIVKYQGSSITDPNIDVQIADHIYDQCNHLNVASAPVNNVDAPNSLSDLRGDTTLDFDSSAEVDAVKRRATATGPGDVPVAYVEDILRDNRRGFSGYTLHGLVAVSNRSIQPHILAHEVGHFLGLEHAGHGSRDLMYEDPETITYAPAQPPRLLRPDCRTVQSRVQPKLTVSTPGDMYEQEADRVADQVMRMPEPHLQNERVYTCAGEFPERRKEQGRKRDFQIRGIRSNRDTGTVASPIVQEVIRSPGQPLSTANRAFFEPRFTHEFRNVRVHKDARAVESARSVNALAYTVGQHIVFGSAQYASDTCAGRRLLAHELTHVVQQRNADAISPYTSIVQRALPPITVPGTPDLSAMDQSTRSQLRILVQRWESRGDNLASGQAATTLATSWLESQGLVQYSGQSHIMSGSPFYLRSPSPQARSASSPQPLRDYGVAGFVFNTTAGTTPLFQAWLWQAEHFSELGIRSRTWGSSKIS